ncbi:MAG TPA: hypothetical protein GX743_03440 [Actinomycetales bacterium]|nr:hypothetical protein [Actinomycetales bacterium]
MAALPVPLRSIALCAAAASLALAGCEGGRGGDAVLTVGESLYTEGGLLGTSTYTLNGTNLVVAVDTLETTRDDVVALNASQVEDIWSLAEQALEQYDGPNPCPDSTMVSVMVVEAGQETDAATFFPDCNEEPHADVLLAAVVEAAR